ncbi:rna-directed dna polymerase from mobile element jockey-like protein [Lasius niger]|uniref:Rna-directed dna polymerase from mobile element jockey-like protein n=1 Tax=Lasius niger TaxID=67767 RepID=A0A0J7JXH8_LASNI|nr:rna-directed dna polymerase from mobile element jockey-like protein [Lasius niger]
MHIFRGFRKEYIPFWNDTSERLYKDFLENGRTEVADDLLHSLNDSRRQKWIETVENLDFKHSSRKAWSLIKKLGGSTHVLANKAEVTPNQVANHIEGMSRATSDKSQSSQALKDVKNGKAPGFDEIHPEFLTHCGNHTRAWLARFYSNMLHTNRLPPEFKRAKIIAILKPSKETSKPPDRPESFRPISLLSTSYKLLECLICNRISAHILDKNTRVIPFFRGITVIGQFHNYRCY